MAQTRRQVMIGAAGAAATALAAPAYAGARLDPNDPQSIHVASRRMRYCDDDRPFFWWLRGLRYGQIDNALTPLFGLNVVSIMQVRSADAESFTPTQLEMFVYTDLATGKPLVDWINPYTNEPRTPRLVPVGPLAIRRTRDGSQPPAALPGARLKATKIPPGPLFVSGDDVWLKLDSAAEVSPLAGETPPYRVNDFAEYHASRRDLENVRRAFVPTVSNFVAVTGWQRWMAMGERPGGSIARAAGRKAQRWADIPADIRGLIEAAYPDIAKDPVAALDLPQFRFDR